MKIHILLLTCILINVEGGKKFVSLGDSSEKFTIDIFKNLMVNSTENQLISPMSIQTILGLLQAGASGKCLEELSKVLHLPKKASLLKDAFQNYLQLINASNIDVTTANTIYVADRFKLPKQYEKLGKSFNATIQQMDSSHPEETVKRINQWVEDQTHNKIKDIVSEDIINTNTVVVLVNALYFNGHWKIPFDDEMTFKRIFYANGGKIQIKTDMMLQTGTYNYTNSNMLKAKILELPYEDEDYVMNVILPNKRDGLSNLVGKISKVFREFEKLEEQEVNLIFPKFQYGYKITLNDLLRKMGINSIFEGMEFKGLKSLNGVLKVSEIVQKTFIDVNEKGSEAAAATAVGIEDRMGGFDKIYFVADHPFIFLIRHKPSGAVLFMGTYNTPEM